MVCRQQKRGALRTPITKCPLQKLISRRETMLWSSGNHSTVSHGGNIQVSADDLLARHRSMSLIWKWFSFYNNIICKICQKTEDVKNSQATNLFHHSPLFMVSSQTIQRSIRRTIWNFETPQALLLLRKKKSESAQHTQQTTRGDIQQTCHMK